MHDPLSTDAPRHEPASEHRFQTPMRAAPAARKPYRGLGPFVIELAPGDIYAGANTYRRARERLREVPQYPQRRVVHNRPGDAPGTAVCAFCQGEPVTNAAAYVDGQPRPAAVCPRCG